MKNPPNFFFCVVVLAAWNMLQMLIHAVLYEVGVGYSAVGPGSMVIATGIVIAAWMSYEKLSYRELFHPAQSSVSSTVLLLAIPVAMVVAGELGWLRDLATKINYLWPYDRVTSNKVDTSFSAGMLTLILLCIKAPFVEEMLFRGLLLRGMLSHYSPKTAIILSAVLFSLAHMNEYQLFNTFVCGLFLGWLFYVSRSLWPCIFAHMLHNGSVFFLSNNGLTQPNSLLTNLIALSVSMIGVMIIAKIYNIRFWQSGQTVQS